MNWSALAILVFGGLTQATLLRVPSDVGDGKGGDHPCVAVMRETQATCDGIPYGSSDDACNFAVCYTADLNRERCADVVTDGAPTNVNFPDDLDKIVEFHAIKCDNGGAGGDGIRNAKFDCGAVGPTFLEEFAAKYPASADSAAFK